MAYIDPESRLILESGRALALTCPHCLVVSHITAVAVPHFEELQASRPTQLGMVFRCDACLAPVFLRFTVRAYGPTRIELSPRFTEIERARERFDFTHLPEEVAMLFREALECFSAGACNAFASMCRRTARAVFTDMGEAGKLKFFDALNEVRELATLTPQIFNKVRSVLFGIASDPRPGIPQLDSHEAGILLEVMKDLLYQTYVRRGRLEQAMLVRRFFHDEAQARTNVTTLTSARP